MNNAFAIDQLLFILVVAVLIIFSAQYLDQQHQENMKVEPKVIMDDFLH